MFDDRFFFFAIIFYRSIDIIDFFFFFRLIICTCSYSNVLEGKTIFFHSLIHIYIVNVKSIALTRIRSHYSQKINSILYIIIVVIMIMGEGEGSVEIN